MNISKRSEQLLAAIKQAGKLPVKTVQYVTPMQQMAQELEAAELIKRETIDGAEYWVPCAS